MSTWEQLDAFLEALVGRLGGTAYILTDSSKTQLSPRHRWPSHLVDEFDDAYIGLQKEFGSSFLLKGSARRRIYAGSSFLSISEPIATSYLLVILLPTQPRDDLSTGRILDVAKPTLAELVVGLPPIGGGRLAAEGNLTKNTPNPTPGSRR